MKRTRRLPACVGLCIFAIFFLSGAGAPGGTEGFWGPGPSEARAAELLDSLSDEEVLGQLFMLAYPGDAPPELLFQWISRRGLGGVKIFGWNAEDTERLATAIASLQEAALATTHRIPLLIATDQEGGWIRHVKGDTSQTPGNMAIGASDRPYDAYWSAYYIGRELDALGINMNFAPSVDLATRPRSVIIGPRAFSADPLAAAVLGTAYMKGMEAAGVIPTAKHFPGHGDTELDSHGTLPVIPIDEATLWDRELLPFRYLVAEGLPAIMSGHLSFPKLVPDGSPASLSPRFMTDILRKRIGFTGLAVTDDLLMAGAQGGSFSGTCLKAVEAGNDLLMASRLIPLDDPAWSRLLAAYKTRPEFRARAREAAGRVLALKLEWLRSRGESALIPDTAHLSERLPDPEGKVFFPEQSFRAATTLDPSLLPWKPSGSLLVASSLADFLDLAEKAYPGAGRFRFSYRPESAALAGELSAFDRALRGVDDVLVCVPNEAGMDFALRARAQGKRVAVVSLLSPAPLARIRPGMASAVVYGMSEDVIRAGLAVLSGAEEPQGRLPLDLSR